MRAYKNYLLALLTLVMVFNYIDRVALGLMLQSIKVDLGLTDTQLGLLTGIAFALFYAVAGIPIARWADRGNRVTIVALTAALWSVAVTLCGRAGSFAQLLVTRMGVAVGEAGCHPPALSLIADYFSRAERPRAVARYMLGWSFALLLGFFAGGWLNQLYGWRRTFVILGLPGIVIAMIAASTLREPRRLHDSAATPSEAPGIPAGPSRTGSTVGNTIVLLWSNRSFRHLLFSCSLSYFFGNGILQWQPAFFARSHGLQSGELGTWFAGIYGFGGMLGTWLGGELVHRYASDDERLQLRAMAVLFVVLAAVAGAVYLAADAYVALGLLVLYAIAGSMFNGPLFAATQTLVPSHMRAMATAVLLFFCNLIGLGLGPLAAGALSDALHRMFGDESLRYALLAMSPGYFWCAWHLWQSSRTVTGDMATACAQEPLISPTLRPLG